MKQLVILQFTTYFYKNGVVTEKKRTEYPRSQQDLVFTLSMLRQGAQIYNYHSDVDLYINGEWYCGAI